MIERFLLCGLAAQLRRFLLDITGGTASESVDK